jgi:hypothetical protein
MGKNEVMCVEGAKCVMCVKVCDQDQGVMPPCFLLDVDLKKNL